MRRLFEVIKKILKFIDMIRVSKANRVLNTSFSRLRKLRLLSRKL